MNTSQPFSHHSIYTVTDTITMLPSSEALASDLVRYFPYKTLRNGQKELIERIYQTALKGGHIAVEAPNGFGKTITVLSGVLPAARALKKKVLYCCRTHQQMDRVIEELQAISTLSPTTGISIRGRTQMCLNSIVTENTTSPLLAMELCNGLKRSNKCEFYTNLRSSISQAANIAFKVTQKPSTAVDIMMLGEKENMCPYEIVRDLLGMVDVTALSYNYIFDQGIREGLLRDIDDALANYILIVDEAHNLPSAAIQILSDSLTERGAQLCIRESEMFGNQSISKLAQNLEEEFTKYKKTLRIESRIDAKTLLLKISPEGEMLALWELLQEMLKIGEQIHKKQIALGKPPRSYIYREAVFLSKLFETKDHPYYLHLASPFFRKDRTTSIRLDVISLDPRAATKDVFGGVHASISLSGTLAPIRAYNDIVGLPPETQCIIAPSPFSRDQMCVLAVQGVSTIMRDRLPAMYKKIVGKIIEVAQGTPGNVGVFAVSYQVQKALLEYGLSTYNKKQLFIENENMTSRENDLLVKSFRAAKHNTGGILMGVMGGRNSEGTDFGGEDMSSVIIVGVPYAQPSVRTEAEINYFDTEFHGKGRDYAYHLPALKKASQAAGRPIRKFTDNGVIVFMDQRYASDYYRLALPGWLSTVLQFVEDKENVLHDIVSNFYSKKIAVQLN